MSGGLWWDVPGGRPDNRPPLPTLWLPPRPIHPQSYEILNGVMIHHTTPPPPSFIAFILNISGCCMWIKLKQHGCWSHHPSQPGACWVMMHEVQGRRTLPQKYPDQGKVILLAAMGMLGHNARSPCLSFHPEWLSSLLPVEEDCLFPWSQPVMFHLLGIDGQIWS